MSCTLASSRSHMRTRTSKTCNWFCCPKRTSVRMWADSSLPSIWARQLSAHTQATAAHTSSWPMRRRSICAPVRVSGRTVCGAARRRRRGREERGAARRGRGAPGGRAGERARLDLVLELVDLVLQPARGQCQLGFSAAQDCSQVGADGAKAGARTHRVTALKRTPISFTRAAKNVLRPLHWCEISHTTRDRAEMSASAPGKVLLTGGYLVLDPLFRYRRSTCGHVFTSSSRPAGWSSPCRRGSTPRFTRFRPRWPQRGASRQRSLLLRLSHPACANQQSDELRRTFGSADGVPVIVYAPQRCKEPTVRAGQCGAAGLPAGRVIDRVHRSISFCCPTRPASLWALR
jgi:hypothetical protein